MKRIIIVSSIFLLFLIGSYFQHNLMEKKLDQIIDLEGQYKKTNEQFISADLLDKELNRVSELFKTNLALSADDIKNEEASIPFLDDLTNLFVELEIEVLDIKPGKKERRGTRNTYIPYELEMNCTFEQLANLINDLEKRERLIIVDEFTFASNTKKLSRNKNNESILAHRVSLTVSSVTLNKAKG